jgi:hypothetical protein
MQHLQKTGGYLSLDVQTFRPSDLATVSSIAPRYRQCHNEPRRKNSSPPGETTPLPPVSNDNERIHPDSVGVASQAWVYCSNYGFQGLYLQTLS